MSTKNQSNGTAVNQSNTAQPEVALKYPEFIHFNTDGILKGTDQGSWDDFWYLSKSTDKHYCSNLNMFCNIRENFLVSNLEKQKKFLFTYGMGEVIIKPVFQAYLIPGVYFAPEVSLNILSIDLLNQQGFEVVSDGDRFVEDVNPTEVHTFQEFVGFLNLIKDYNVGATFSVHFGQEFGAIAEILGLTRNDGDDVKKVYMVYLDVFVSYYKTARAPQAPLEAVED
ncbi:hypothetical protein Tco_0858390 [Tanacetum coccineum]|uniref:ARID DNA-binding domain-containing protein n=1 Tax=Tanacetum coccineum TaxID=301880 RepID=A0ABQ5B9Z9_9ASTR